ncbi:hypothetical protein GT045_29590 [Streptomyces sp. SID486]|uniref:hypothetical protein n=1 Tax=Streptomyces sp. SID486 TaxID=2690264 RepID=UPI001370CB01|nr:hypothetical protein [Streptomyces sp. SID486]MYX98845.1 hypothetical protein [Streptomyces sp. SID486]
METFEATVMLALLCTVVLVACGHPDPRVRADARSVLSALLQPFDQLVKGVLDVWRR